MVILLGALAVLFVLVGVVAAQVARSTSSDNLGTMSNQWLAEHRASHHRPLGD
jgi:hypothetical protein